MRYVIASLIAICMLAGVAAAQDLIITEFMYKDNNDGGDWIELYNRGTEAIVLDGLHMVDGDPGIPHDTHDHCYLVGTLLPGEAIVVVGDFADFETVYGTLGCLNANAHDPAGGNGFGLGGGGDTVFILDAGDVVIYEMTYTDDPPWPPEPDGDGPTLVLCDLNCPDFSDAGCWIVGVDGGEPCTVDIASAVENVNWGSVKELFR